MEDMKEVIVKRVRSIIEKFKGLSPKEIWKKWEELPDEEKAVLSVVIGLGIGGGG